MWRFLKKWILPIAMLAGILLAPWMNKLAFLAPYMLFLMLFFSFSKLSPREIHFRKSHLLLLLIQTIGTLVVYYLLLPFDPIVAQGVMLCVLAPTATAAAVVTHMLGGSIAYITTYLLFCNIMVAIGAPALFSMIGVHNDWSFWISFFYICKHVVPLLLVPLLLAWGIRLFSPKISKKIQAVSGVSFYLWSFTLTILIGNTVYGLLQEPTPNYKMNISLAVGALIICIAQFVLGRYIGRKYNDPISVGQGLGQKNTILVIWMAQTYLNPLSAIGPASYVIWQNTINSWQLWKKRKNEIK